MIAAQVAGWLALGFITAAVLLYGPMTAKAYWIKHQALQALKDSNKRLRESTGKEKEYALFWREHNELQATHIEDMKQQTETLKELGELQEKYIALLDELNALQQGRTKELQDALKGAQEYGELLRKYNALLEKYEGKPNLEGAA